MIDEGQIFDDVDTTVRAMLRDIGARYINAPEQGNFAVCSLVPIVCAAIEELGRAVDPALRRKWAESLYRTADRLSA